MVSRLKRGFEAQKSALCLHLPRHPKLPLKPGHRPNVTLRKALPRGSVSEWYWGPSAQLNSSQLISQILLTHIP